jgi:uncharacterized membrane protein (UPF0182 family)
MMSSANQQFNFPRKRGPLPITIGILVALGAIVLSLSGFYADWLWFKSVNFTSVWSTVLFTKIELFIVTGLITSFVISLNVYLAFRKRPFYVPMAVEADNLERYRAQIEPIRRWVFAALALALFYFEWIFHSSLSAFHFGRA